MRWIDKVETDLGRLGVRRWRTKAKDRRKFARCLELSKGSSATFFMLLPFHSLTKVALLAARLTMVDKYDGQENPSHAQFLAGQSLVCITTSPGAV
ncbi:hypothetical protein C0J52_10764 [Blattella germanica]|nr:hypothetical protein C0J52_10764 [Blattella germanica]